MFICAANYQDQNEDSITFSNHGEKQPLLSIVFFLIYIIGVLVNLIIIIVIYLDSHLHTPMYFFLCTLAFVDICYPTVTLPKLMDILLSGDNSITLIQCFTQMYFFLALAAVEATLLASMAYDRYVAICKPLQYHLIMNRRFCVLAIVGIWISALVNSAFLTHLASKLANCGSNKIKQFFCEIKGVAYISCDRTTFYGAIYVEAFFYGITTFSLNLLSYINIIRNILHIKSKHGRQRAFSTCTSHFIVLIIFYGSGMWTYLRPPSQSEELDQVFTVLLVGVTPMLNPLIYSLRNKEVQNALLRICTSGHHQGHIQDLQEASKFARIHEPNQGLLHHLVGQAVRHTTCDPPPCPDSGLLLCATSLLRPGRHRFNASLTFPALTTN
ncbi:olfactory receptor 8H1-like [Xenopus laevis]|uniref:Olfactory receptor n=1 Tax=Xenopus laevis TaxID=8355 RepID=A0A8J1MRN1_XENLA|nr:olfactory receptor 8H1-like [Xenopus laevis]